MFIINVELSRQQQNRTINTIYIGNIVNNILYYYYYCIHTTTTLRALRQSVLLGSYLYSYIIII